MTGRHTGHATVRGNLHPHIPLTPDETTLAHIFARAGYRNGAFGKWGLGVPSDMHALPTRKGFHEFYGYLDQTHAHNYYTDTLWDNERQEFIEENYSGAKGKYSHDLIAERALKFLDEHHQRPFFLYAPFTPPHGRFDPPSDQPYSDKPWPETARKIAAMITRLDETVGKIMERLQRYGIERNTLVMFTSDNGPGGLSARQFKSSGPLRGFKRDLYEGGIRVPFIARWPGSIQPGVSNEVFASWDLLPTMAELVGQKAPPGLDGISVVAALLGKGKAANGDRVFYWEFHERAFQQAVRWRDWKAIRLKQGAPIELYDLSMDFAERKNLAAEKPDLASKLSAMIDAARTPSPHWPHAPTRKT
jgi:arylsulfatase A-like enzyme